jgi:signal transduction histidine kinase
MQAHDMPAPVWRYLERQMLEQRSLMCVELDANGVMLQQFGSLPAGGGNAHDVQSLLDIVTGLSLSEEHVIPLVQLGSGEPVHVHFTHAEGRRFVIAFTAESAYAELGTQQQLANELALSNVEKTQTIQALTQAQTLLRDSERELKRAHDLKSIFISKMSHEFGTPITAVIGRIKLLEQELEQALGSAHEPINAHFAVVRRGVMHLHQLVQSVLDEARLEQGTLRLEPGRVALSAIAEDLELLFFPLALEKNLTFSVAIEREQAIWIDGLRLKQILINLVSNAIKYTPSGKVSLYLHWRQGRLSASVQDTGPGMSREQASSLFKPFRRLDEKTQVSGTGLGLAISLELAEHMGGTIDVQSTLGQGSRFVLTLPCELARESTSLDTGKLKVLVVDDDTDIRELLVLVLSREGAAVSQAENGAGAETLWRQLQPDVILLDMQLGTEDGAQVAKSLRKLGAASRIVALSASNSDETSRKALEGGCDAFLSKPVDFERLRRLMQE